VTQVIKRIDKLLDAFSEDAPSLSLSDLAGQAGLPKSSAHRLLVGLEEIGMLERDGPNWRLGKRVVLLANIRLGQIDLRAEASRQLRTLGQRLRAATAFSIPDGCDMVYLERHESPVPFAPAARLGSRAPIWAGAAGKAVLACLDPEERLARLQTDERWLRLSQLQRRSIERELDQTARRRYALDPGTFFEGVGGAAVAIADVTGEPVAALSVIIPQERYTRTLGREMGRQLTEVAKEIEAAAHPH